MAATDSNVEWLGHVQPTGLVVAPAILTRHGLVPEEQIRADGDAVAEHLAKPDDGPALPSPWGFFEAILGWQAAQVAGAVGGPPLPDDLAVHLPDADTTLLPTWAVAEPDGGWQILVRIEAPGTDADARSKHGWEATPHQRLERLLRETGVPTGLLQTDTHLRLIYAPRGETSGWLAFPLRELATVGGRPMLGALKLLLSAFRLFNDAADRRLPGLLHASREAQAEVSARLATQVLGALHELLRGLHAADRARIERLAAQRPAHLYEGLLTVLLRLVFLLYAEDRALIPSHTDGPARALYEEGYGVRALHARLLGDAARYPDTMDERRGAWSRLLALFRLVHAGDISGWIRGRGGKLFNYAVFPFLLGQDAPDAPLDPAPVTDGCILRVLDGLMVLEGERLSYRTLDVEQIGSVYETVMGFTVLAMPGLALAIRAGRNNRTPVFVDLAVLASHKPAEREKYLKEEANRSGQLPAKVKQALTAASGAAALTEALRPIVDERGSPGGHTALPGTPLLQPTDERRRTGSHYTPRSLTEPIVRHALEPAFERIGEDATPEQVLELKVCDPAMGSGAFLVEACRQLAARLVRAWTLHRGTRPEIPPDEDEDLLARRLVAQRCLYGVDRNPMATDLARLSLWLATLARDHEFTFLDHALKTGDSLVGLTARQIGALTWGDDRQGSLFGRFVAERVQKVVQSRTAIREAPDDVLRAGQEAEHAVVEATMADVRALGDAVLACFFAEAKPKARQAAMHTLQDLGVRDNEAMWSEVRKRATTLAHGPHPVRPFHWELEFPEVFARGMPGFDAIFGNPPFLGGTWISGTHGQSYFDWLKEATPGAGNRADLVAYFFRRAFSRLSHSGAFGLIATNTIAQGDTRVSGLEQITLQGGVIYRAEKRLRWPGEAAVVVSVVHVSRSGGTQRSIASPHLDGRPVPVITAFLFHAGTSSSPTPLVANAGFSFKGVDLLGMGFTFDDTDKKGVANPLSLMGDLLKYEPRSSERILPYIGGEEINESPTQAYHRYAIQLSDLSEQEAREQWPDLLRIVEQKVRPERMKVRDNAHGIRLKKFWWRFNWSRPELFNRIRNMSRVIACSQVSAQHQFAMLNTGLLYANYVIVFAFESDAAFANLQSRVHETWVRFFASSMKDDLRYTPSDCFDTFPFPADHQSNPRTGVAGRAYLAERATLMTARNEGLTKTYNRFHDPAERAPDIQSLRELHHAMDIAVLRAYGWDDLADGAAPEYLTGASEPDHRYQGRLFWPAAFRDEVLARLLDLNRAGAEEERRLGLSPRGAKLLDDADTEEAA